MRVTVRRSEEVAHQRATRQSHQCNLYLWLCCPLLLFHHPALHRGSSNTNETEDINASEHESQVVQERCGAIDQVGFPPPEPSERQSESPPARLARKPKSEPSLRPLDRSSDDDDASEHDARRRTAQRKSPGEAERGRTGGGRGEKQRRRGGSAWLIRGDGRSFIGQTKDPPALDHGQVRRRTSRAASRTVRQGVRAGLRSAAAALLDRSVTPKRGGKGVPPSHRSQRLTTFAFVRRRTRQHRPLPEERVERAGA